MNTRPSLPSAGPDADQLLRDVQEELQQEQLKAFWQRYGRWLLLAVVLVLVVTASVVAYRQHVMDERLAAGAALDDILRSSETELAKQQATLSALAAEKPKTFAAILARLQAAALARQQDDAATAIKIYDELLAMPQLPAELAGLTKLYRLQTSWQTANPAEREQQLIELFKYPDFAPFAKELQALGWLENNETAKARDQLLALSQDTSSPPALKTRAAELAHMLANPAK